MSKQRIVIFDLDHTLTQKGTWGRFVSGSLRGQWHLWIPFICLSIAAQMKYRLGFGPREQVKETMMRWTLAGRSQKDLQARALDFARQEVDHGLRRRSKEILGWHQGRGDRVLIASAAVDLIVEPICGLLNIEEWVCTQTSYDKSGILKPKIKGRNCYGAGKLHMVKAYLDRNSGFTRGRVHITMYSDGYSDLDILRWADIGIAVNPSRKLAKIAPRYGFEVQNWD